MKLTKKSISIFMALLILLCACPFTTANAITEGEFMVTQEDNGENLITGYTGDSTDLVIPSEIDGVKITGIASNAFSNNKNLVSVTISEGIKTIDINAFSFCPKLETVNVPNGLISVSTFAFSETPYYSNLPDGLVYLGNLAFEYRGDMPENTEIEIKPGTISINASAFWYQNNLTKITLPDGLEYIRGEAFTHCGELKEIDIPDTVKEIGYAAFEGCSNIQRVKIPEGITTVEANTFSGCSKLSQVEFPESLTTVGDAAFMGCAMTEINLPESVTVIGQDSFSGTGYFNDENNWTDSILYYKNFALNSKVDIAEANIKEGTTYICAGLFDTRGRLTSVIMPDTVTAMGNEVFSFTTMLSKVEFSENLEAIPTLSFNGSAIKSIEIPSGVKEIRFGAFYDHTNLKTITIPASVTEIGYQAVGYFSNYGFEGRYGVTIYGEAGSAAEEYAKSNNINFVEGKPEEKPTEPVDPSQTIAVYFKNTDNFSNPYAYYWPKSGSGSVEWPGVPMIDCGDGVYMVYVPAGNDMVIFSDAGSGQTRDLSIPGANQIYENGTWSPYEEGSTEPTEPTEPTTEPTEPTTAPESKILIGDVDLNGELSVTDATLIQKQIVGLFEFSAEAKKAADTEMDGNISIKDATAIQCYIIGLNIDNSHCGEYI